MIYSEHFDCNENSISVIFKTDIILKLVYSDNYGKYIITYIDRISSSRDRIINQVLKRYEVKDNDPLYDKIRAGLNMPQEYTVNLVYDIN